MELLTSESLEQHKRMISGVLLLCCLYYSLKFLGNPPADLCVNLIRLMYILPQNEGKEVDYLQSLMRNSDSK